MFKKKCSVIIFAFIMFISVGLFSFESKAANAGAFFLDYAEPAVNENAGYLSLLLWNEYSNGYMINTYFWNLTPSSGGVEASAYMIIEMAPHEVRFNVGGDKSNGVTAYMHLGLFGADGRQNEMLATSTDVFEQPFPEFMSIKGYIYKGNIGNVKGLTSDYPPTECNADYFDIHFEDSPSAKLISDILYQVTCISGDTNDIMSNLFSIMNSVDGVENQLSSMISYLQTIDGDLKEISTQLQAIYNKADEILNEQKIANSWLEKIFDYLNESQEQQKQEAEIQGGNSTSQGMDAIEDKGAGFTDSLGGLVSSMSYSGTECAWNFPEVKLPAISGVMDEIVLMESQPIDFAQWVNAIPNDILIVVQSLLTIGLIVYCFKELYSTIAYVLTLRKDDNA